MPTFKENFNEYTEEISETTQSKIDSAVNYAKEDDIDAKKTAEQEKEIASFASEVNELQSKMLSWIKVDFKTPDSINHFYRIENGKIVFQIDQVKSYLEDVYKRLSWMKKQKFWEVSKEKNFTGTILAIQIALKAMSSDPKNPKQYYTWNINWEYDNMTKEAIKKFQSDKKIENDWKPWKWTIEKLLNAINILIDNKKAEQQKYETLKKDISNIINESIAINPLSWFYPNQIKEALTIYIVEWNINSWKNPEFESQLINLSNHALNRKLQYLLSNSDKPIADNIAAIQGRKIQQNINLTDNTIERNKELPTTISEKMFHELLTMEGWQWYVAQIHKKFKEKFVTWPYGMTQKHIDRNGKLLSDTIPFRNWERVSKEWSLKNAKTYYDKRAKEWANELKTKWLKYTQEMLDALVSASWGTQGSVTSLKNFVFSNWWDKIWIFNFLIKFARTAAWSGEILWGLVARRELEANWFIWNTEKSYRDYQREYAQKRKRHKRK